jgi:hypothetical protein
LAIVELKTIFTYALDLSSFRSLSLVLPIELAHAYQENWNADDRHDVSDQIEPT